MKSNKERTDINRLTNILLSNREKYRVICFTNIGTIPENKEIINAIKENLIQRMETVEIFDESVESSAIFDEKIYELKRQNQIVLVDEGAIEENKMAAFFAGKCDQTIILIQKNNVEGKKAMEYLWELKMNGAKVLGSIFVE